MNARIQRMVHGTVCRFIGQALEKTDSQAYTDLLDIYSLWEDYRQQHASGYLVDPKEINKALIETFGSDIKLDEDASRVYGLTKKAQRQPKVKKQLTAIEIEKLGKDSEMQARFNKFIYDRGPSMRTAPFETFQFANFKQSELAEGSYRMICRECSLEEAKEWLSRQDYLYFNDTINNWCFHQRAVLDYS